MDVKRGYNPCARLEAALALSRLRPGLCGPGMPCACNQAWAGRMRALVH